MLGFLKELLKKYEPPVAAAAPSINQQQLARLLRYSSSFAQSLPIEANPGYPSDFIDDAKIAEIIQSNGMLIDSAKVVPAIRKDTAPIPATNNREGYFGDNHLAFWLSGLSEYHRLCDIAASHGVSGGNYFDFGGSTGRIFRHFHFQSTDWTIWSGDFKMTSVEWNLANFPSEIIAFQGSYFPVLPVEDQTFDFVTAMSVFTHIDETETSWLLELRRVMKTGGIAVLTIHNEDTWLNMSTQLRDVIEKYSPELAKHPTLPPGKSVSTFRNDDPYRCNTFHSNDYIHAQWSRFFEVKDIIPRASGAQAAVVLKKR